MGRSAVETVMGGVVLLVAAFFVIFAIERAQVGGVSGYTVTAAFFKVGGLSNGADVRISGIKVGTVRTQTLDAETYDALVSLSIEASVKLPVDTVASIASDGMLGGKFVRLEPGAKKKYIADGGMIVQTKDFRSLEDQVGEIIFLATGNTEGPK